jgi:hypothetical protein
MTRLIRVFPRRTKAMPSDALAYFGAPDRFAAADEVHVDCTFTYDRPIAERLAEQWRHVAPTKLETAAEPFIPAIVFRRRHHASLRRGSAKALDRLSHSDGLGAATC